MNRSLLPLALAAFLAGPCVSTAEESALGKEIFLGSCAACHGASAEGDGPMAELITVQVADLTRISLRNGGQFPWLKVVHLVDGRTGLRGHGGPMPLFGTLFAGDTAVADGPDGTPVITSRRVLAVVDYLASIQKEE